MTRAELEHLIRAAGAIADVEDLIVVGSQSILGQFPGAPSELLISREADLFPRDDPSRSDLIDATIGEGSPFENSFGYYAHGVDETTCVLPDGWRDRLILVAGENTRHIRGWCLDVHDLAIAKYAAGREKDLDFTAALARHGMTDLATLETRLRLTNLDPAIRELAGHRIRRHFGSRV